MPGKRTHQSLMFSPQTRTTGTASNSTDFGSNSAMIGKLAGASHAEAAAAGIDLSAPSEKSIDDQIYDDFAAHLSAPTEKSIDDQIHDDFVAHLSAPTEKSIDDQIHDDFVAHLTGGDLSQSLQ